MTEEVSHLWGPHLWDLAPPQVSKLLDFSSALPVCTLPFHSVELNLGVDKERNPSDTSLPPSIDSILRDIVLDQGVMYRNKEHHEECLRIEKLISISRSLKTYENSKENGPYGDDSSLRELTLDILRLTESFFVSQGKDPLIEELRECPELHLAQRHRKLVVVRAVLKYRSGQIDILDSNGWEKGYYTLCLPRFPAISEEEYSQIKTGYAIPDFWKMANAKGSFINDIRHLVVSNRASYMRLECFQEMGYPVTFARLANLWLHTLSTKQREKLKLKGEETNSLYRYEWPVVTDSVEHAAREVGRGSVVEYRRLAPYETLTSSVRGDQSEAFSLVEAGRKKCLFLITEARCLMEKFSALQKEISTRMMRDFAMMKELKEELVDRKRRADGGVVTPCYVHYLPYHSSFPRPSLLKKIAQLDDVRKRAVDLGLGGSRNETEERALVIKWYSLLFEESWRLREMVENENPQKSNAEEQV